MTIRLKNTKKYLAEYSKNLLKLAKLEIEKTDRTRSYKSGNITGPINASGSLKDSLEIRGVKTTDVIYNYSILGNEYGEAVDEGTSSSTPPVSKLINWLVSKNKTLLDSKQRTVELGDIKKVRRIAFAIQKSLSIIGIQKTGFLTNLVEEEFKQLNDIYKPVVKDIEVDIDNILIKAGYKKTGKETYVIETKKIK